MSAAPDQPTPVPAAFTVQAAPDAVAAVAADPSTAAAAGSSDLLQPAAAAAPIRAASPLEHQVAGHGGVMEDESGELVIKPALPREIAFYQLIASAPRSSPLAGLRSFTPKFIGTLRLAGRDAGSGQIAPIPGASDVPESVVLENLAAPFTRPCVMDIKLGTVLHAPDATPEKAARMEKKARESTIGKKGMRLTGSKTWHEPTQAWIETPRSFGYAMTPERLPEGMVRFFPLPTDVLPCLSDEAAEAEPEPEAGAGAGTQPASTSAKAFTGHAMPARLTLRVLVALDEHLARLEAALQRLEIRAVGASLLVVYEGDAARLASAFERYDARRVARAARSLADVGGHEHALGDEIDPDSEDDDEDVDEFDDEDEDDDDDDDDGTKADARRAARAPPLTVRLIDFAHTWLAQGEGPDAGVLFGLETVRALVAGRIAEVRAWMAENEPAAAAQAPQASASASAASAASVQAP